MTPSPTPQPPLPNPHSPTPNNPQERLRRWRLILGGGAADGICGSANGNGMGDDGFSLAGADQAIDGSASI